MLLHYLNKKLSFEKLYYILNAPNGIAYIHAHAHAHTHINSHFVNL